MAKPVRYLYDEESCSFFPEQITLKTRIKSTLPYIGASLLLSALILAGVFSIYDSPKEVLLRKQNQMLAAQIGLLEGQFAQLEEQVNGLHKQDNEFYRSLMQAEPMDNGEWQSGIGGAVGQDSLGVDVLDDAKARIERLNNKIQLQNKSYEFLFTRLADNTEELRHTPAIKPVKGRIISGFGWRMHPIQNFRKLHTGIDMEAAMGTEVFAAADGVVKLADVSQGGYGLQVEIEHGSFGYVTKYAHLSQVKVRAGQRVKRGEVVGYSGSSGLSKGPHLHYEIIKRGEKINPIDYFYGDQTPQEYVQLRQDAEVENMSMD
ncbi:MAG: M23 family metallopeptidase [Bacteroidia bacterium]|nr:M23 family metallopeptidase [Bacteroidia bacterium]